MSWQALRFEPHLPPHCQPNSDYLYHLSSSFHVCVPTDLAFISTLLGTLSIVSWLFAQLPQIYKNYALQSTSGLSIYFLAEWCLGDLSNLLGAIFTRQAKWQIVVAGYYCFVDFILVLQWVWYERLRHGSIWLKSRDTNNNNGDEGMTQVVIDGVSVQGSQDSSSSAQTQAKDIKFNRSRTAPVWRMPVFGTPTEKDEKEGRSPASGSFGSRRLQVQPSSSVTGPSPRTVLFLACLVALAQASPTPSSAPAGTNDVAASPVEYAGTVLSWLSTLLYLLSRLPQLYKNYQRRSTSGLSPHLFAAAFFGNLFYSSSILTNPSAWYDFGSFGGGGWAGPEGSQRADWILRALPFWLGAAGVLGLDGAMGIQFMIYGEGAKMVLVQDEEVGRARWKRVSGWMRGWVPSFSEARAEGENRPLLSTVDGEREYGTGTSAR